MPNLVMQASCEGNGCRLGRVLTNGAGHVFVAQAVATRLAWRKLLCGVVCVCGCVCVVGFLLYATLTPYGPVTLGQGPYRGTVQHCVKMIHVSLYSYGLLFSYLCVHGSYSRTRVHWWYVTTSPEGM